MKKEGIATILLLGILLVSGLACCGSGEWRLLTYTEGEGTISPSTDTIPDGEVVTLTALPESGWSFDHWGGQISGSENPINIIMDSDKTVSAYFSIAPTPTPTPTPEVISITASKLCADYYANEPTADQKYKGKILEVSLRIDTNGREPRAYLAADCGIPANIWCYFDAAYESQLVSLEEGDYVTVRGTCEGIDMFSRIIIEHCTVN